jgi:hypothetical protein
MQNRQPSGSPALILGPGFFPRRPTEADAGKRTLHISMPQKKSPGREVSAQPGRVLVPEIESAASVVSASPSELRAATPRETCNTGSDDSL